MLLGLQLPTGDSRRLRAVGDRGSVTIAGRPIVLSICPIGKTPASLSLIQMHKILTSEALTGSWVFHCIECKVLKKWPLRELMGFLDTS